MAEKAMKSVLSHHPESELAILFGSMVRGEERFDIVIHRRGAPNRPIDQSALEQGVRIL